MWSLKFSDKADKQLSKMDGNVRRTIIEWLIKNIDGCENPRSHGKGLTGNHSKEWRYRVGDYRILCDIQDGLLIILAFDIDHRSKIYKR